MNHKHSFRYFLRYFGIYLWVVRKVLFSLFLLVISGAVLISIFEKISLGHSIYLSFITAFTIGYGDVTPVTTIGRILCVMIGLIGIIFTGLVVAVSTRALASTIEEGKRQK